MATENIVIKFSVDKTQLDGAVTSSKALENELKKAGVSAEYIDSAMEGVADALSEANVDAKTFNKALADSANSTKSLKTQLADAKNEAVRMSQQFGAFSKEAREAAKRAADIKDQIGDLNDTLDALNPEAKLNAFVKLGQGIQGGFQAATGALQVFGVENERITKLAQQFQGVLNLTQGINSVLQLKDVYGQLRLVLGLTTVAQNGLNVATETGTVATRGFTAALASNPFTAVAVALTALVAGVIAYTAATDDSTEATAENNAELDRQIEKQNQLAEAYENSRQVITRAITDQRLKLALAKGDIDELTAAIQQNEINRGRAVQEFIAQYGNDILAIADINKKFGIEEQLIRAEFAAKKAKEKIKEVQVDGIKSMSSLGAETAKTSSEILKLSTEAFQNLIDTFRILDASPYDVKKAVEELKRSLESLEPVYRNIGKLSSEIKPVGFDDEETPEQRQARINRGIIDYGNLVIQTYQLAADFRNAQYQEEINQLEDLKQRKIITDEQYQQRLRIIKRKQAEDDKQTQLFAATMAGALALVNALTVTPSSAIPAALATAAITTAINLARIQAAPIPKYKTGTLNVGGGSLDSDGGMHAIIHKGEAVIPADRNRDYHPTIAALFHRKINPSEINSFVQMKLNGTIPSNIQAHISSKDLRGLKSPESVNIRNSTILAKQIGKEIARSYDPRMR